MIRDFETERKSRWKENRKKRGINKQINTA